MSFVRRVRESQGESIVILTASDAMLLSHQDEMQEFLELVSKVRYRMRLASRDADIVTAARAEGITVFTTTKALKGALGDHEEIAAVLRLFSPHLWRQQWRSHLQRIGLLSLPKVRIWVFGGLCLLLFLFVIFRLLPSADITIQPKRDTIDYTTNIVLVVSGSSVVPPTHVRTLTMVPFSVTINRTIDFDQISKEFIGTSASVQMTLINKSTQEYSLKQGTRLVNQAGMIFKLDRKVFVPAGGTGTVLARAADQDLYGQDIGERGNVPAGLRWDLPGLSPDERAAMYAVNRKAATGGHTASRTVLQQKDLQVGSELLKSQLLQQAKDMVAQALARENMQHPDRDLVFLTKDDVIKKTYSGFVLPVQMLGKPVQSAPFTGTLTYTMYAYDVHEFLDLLKKDSSLHVIEGKRILPDSFTVDRLRVYIIDYDDSLAWIKVTADLLGLQEFVLDPLTPAGARFAKRVRETISGLSVQDAERIVKNMPEVEKATITLWPPWATGLPAIPSNISIVTQ